jgi:AraC-like DNA-binding protein
LAALSQTATLVNPLGLFRFVRSEGRGAVHYSVAAERTALGTQLNEYTVALLVDRLNGVLGGRLPLLEVCFPHRRNPSIARSLEAHFGCPVRFSAPDVGFAVHQSVLERIPATSDAALFAYMQRQAQAALSSTPGSDVVTQVVRIIELRLTEGKVDADAVARAMATTARSLQRRLAEAGTTYRRVLAHVRRRRGDELRHAGYTESEIARALGFSDARSMRRSLVEDQGEGAG